MHAGTERDLGAPSASADVAPTPPAPGGAGSAGPSLTAVVDKDPPWPSPARAWAAVGVLLVVYVFSFADRQILSLLVGPIKADFGLNDTQFSLLSGFAFALFYTVLGLPFGRLADRYSRRRLIAVGAVLWSAMTVACALSRNYTQLFLARVGVGVGEAALAPAAYSILGDLFPRDRLARAFSVYSLGIYIGIGLAFSLGGLVVGAVAATPVVDLPLFGTVASWQAVFIVVGAPGLLLPLLIYTIPEPVRRGRAAAAGVAGPTISQAARWVRTRARVLGPYSFGFAAIVLANIAVLTWVPELFIRIHGASARDAGVSIGLTMAVAGSVGVLAGGWLADRLTRAGRQDSVLLVGIVAALGGLAPGVAFPLVADAGLALGLAAVVFFFGAFASGAAPSGLAAIVPNELRGQVAALFLLVLNLTGLALGPTLPALLTDFVFRDPSRLGWSLAAVMLVMLPIATALLLAARRPYVVAAANRGLA